MLALGDEVVAVSVQAEPEKASALRETWERWNPGVRLEVVDGPHRSLVEPMVAYVRGETGTGREVAVLIPEVEPRHRRYALLQNQRGLLRAAVPR
ncbi:hypothetical protein AB0D24_40070 [Streptomyces javensis]|uniref:hypothetical protein n=1 Tax=Streptomyces javensis TaxID=114698 RepID=UPI0033EC12FB